MSEGLTPQQVREILDRLYAEEDKHVQQLVVNYGLGKKKEGEQNVG